MRPVLTASEYRRVDRAYQGDLIAAMDRAGHAVALAAARAGAGYGKRVVVLAGPGNNGGDGNIAAGYLKRRGVYVEVHKLAPSTTAESRDAEAKALANRVPIMAMGEVVPADVVVDALFGGGMLRGLPEEVASWMDTDAPVIAVDFPTGLDPDTGAVAERAFHAVETVTFGCVKTGHVQGAGPDHCGQLTVVDIGISGGEPSMFLVDVGDAPRPSRSRKTHKWDAGAVLVVGGSKGLIGACTLAGRAALAFGAGTVHLATPQPALAQEIAPELPCHDLVEAPAVVGRFDVVLAGPGLAKEDLEKAAPIVARAERVVLDAGGITREMVVAARQNGGEVVITPHDAEFAALSGVGAGAFSIRSLAKRAGVTVLRKGNPTMITDGGLPILVTSGGPELASMGTGDVLSGIIAALWARGLTGRESAVSGAYWHGVAGAELARDRSLTAEGLVDLIGRYAW